MRHKGELRLAISQFPVTADIRKNADWMRRHMKRAAARRAEIIHFSEACVSGYAGASFPSFDGFDWDTLKEQTDSICGLAAELGLWVVLGTAHKRRGGRPHNSLYLVSDKGQVVKRYHKCFCTGQDLHHYQPGRRFVTHALNGVKFGLLICYDFRFPEMYRRYLLKGCRLVFHSFHMSQPKPNKLMLQMSPAHLASRAAENFMYVSANNTSRPHQWFASRVHAPDGSVLKTLKIDRPGLLVADVDLSRDDTYYNAPGHNALRAATGVLYSETHQ